MSIERQYGIIMTGYPERIEALITALTRLPGIGKRSAERITLYLLKARPEEVYRLAESIGDAKRQTRFCTGCGNFSTDPTCTICQDTDRDPTVVCVVQEPRDISRIESAGQYRGVYHVLFGVISPLEGVGPSELRISELERRIKKEKIREIILAISTNTDGETTSAYLVDLLKRYPVHITRLARGLPFGSSLEFADEQTLGNALEFRQSV